MLHYDEYGSVNNPTILLLHGAEKYHKRTESYS